MTLHRRYGPASLRRLSGGDGLTKDLTEGEVGLTKDLTDGLTKDLTEGEVGLTKDLTEGEVSE